MENIFNSKVLLHKHSVWCQLQKSKPPNSITISVYHHLPTVDVHTEVLPRIVTPLVPVDTLMQGIALYQFKLNYPFKIKSSNSP